MPKVTVQQVYGNFDLTVEVEVEDSHINKLVELGCLQVLQRVPASAADKALDGKNWRAGKRDGTLLKPEKWSRTEALPFTAESAAALKAGAMGKTMAIAEGVNVPFRVVAVSQHEGGDASPMKRATAFVDLMLTTPGMEGVWRTQAGALGLAEAATATRDELITFAHSKGFGADPKKV